MSVFHMFKTKQSKKYKYASKCYVMYDPKKGYTNLRCIIKRGIWGKDNKVYSEEKKVIPVYMSGVHIMLATYWIDE